MISKKRKEEIKEMLMIAYEENFDTDNWLNTLDDILEHNEEEKEWANEHLALGIVEK